MSSKLTAMFPPHFGIGFDWKISSALRRKSSIHSGSSFIAEIWRTISASTPLRALKTGLETVWKSYLLISPTGSAVSISVLIFDSLGYFGLLFFEQGPVPRFFIGIGRADAVVAAV